MSLGADIVQVLPELRAAAESLMTDTVRIVSLGAAVADEWGVVTVPEVLVYEGRCKVQDRQSYEARREAGGATLVANRDELHVPAFTPADAQGDVTAIRRGHKATITATGPGSTTVLGRVYRIANNASGTHKTARRFPVEDYPS